jgi:glyoxylase-like metal-dependent hydrolase (beta-lactamase superfamily II)
MSTEELQDRLAAGQPVTVVDIREPADREWSIPGSIQVDAYDAVKSGSLGPLAGHDFPPGPVVTVCASGRTAATAADLLRATGVQAVTLEGGMRAWSLAWNTAQTTFSGCEIVQVALATPGHTAESTTYLLDDAAAFTGDTLLLAGVGRPDLEGGTPEESASRARLLYASVSGILDLPEAARVLPGHVSEPIPFDGRLLASTVKTIRDTVVLARLDQAASVEAVLARIPPNPPNHSRIVELNERGELPEDPSELEAGANRCAVD